MLHGRAKERTALDALLERARAGQGGCLVLHGEPGIGKTALLEYAAGSATDGEKMQLLRTAGVEQETDIGYATLHRLLLPVLERIDRLPEPQTRALGVAFGQAAAPAPDRFLVALAVLSLLSDAAGERPVLCLVDDAHWADAASLHVLAFVARRLEAEPVAAVVAMRADEGRPWEMSGLTSIPLAGLDRDAALALFAEHGKGGMAAAERDELLHATGGNPLAIRELPATVWRGASGEPVPLAGRLRRAFLERVRRRDPAAQRMLLLVAADGTGRLDWIRKAAAVLGSEAGPDVLDDLGDLVVQDGLRVTFGHPLIRSAVYHAAGQDERRAVHRVLAKVLEGHPAEADRRAWHLGQAADGPDEQVAGELERSAERALRRAGPAAAAAALARAAELSSSDQLRAGRLLAAADAWWQAGDTAHAAELLAHTERFDALPEGVLLDIAALRALMELRSGSPYEAVMLLRPLLPEALRTDRRRAVRLLMLLGEGCFHANVATAYAETAAILDELTVAGSDADAALLRLLRGAHRVRSGDAPGLEPGDLDVIDRLTDPVMLCWAGGLAFGIGDLERARRLRSSGVRRARSLGAASTLAWALEFVVFDELGQSRFAAAEAFADEGHRLALETGQPTMACRHLGWLAMLAAIRGRADDARRIAEDVLAEAATRDLAGAAATARRALGLLDLVAGRPHEATRHLEERDSGDATHPGIALYNVPDLVEAAVHADQPDRAGRLLRDFSAWSDAAGAPDLRALAARCRALLASGDTAEAEFHWALDLHDRADQPMEKARTELLLGEHLRRARRRSDARPHLRAALEAFHRLGAPAWADRAQQELRATGEKVRHRQLSAVDTLTPQELRIAVAVSEGVTNREVAAQLFLSPRTIDYHLRKVFQKLGITSRAELIRLTLTQDIHQPPGGV